jgi:hypothetical protein
MPAGNPILTRAKLPDYIAIVSYFGALMEGMNEQTSIRMEDLTLYPYCIRFEREPHAKMKLGDNSNTLCINGENNRDPNPMGTKFGHCKRENERMQRNSKVKEQRFKDT